MVGLQDVAFLRSPLAHAASCRAQNRMSTPTRYSFSMIWWACADSHAVGPSRLQVSEYPPLATDRVRFVGEPLAMCVAANRALAEDLTETVRVEYDELPAIASCTRWPCAGRYAAARALGRQPVPGKLHGSRRDYRSSVMRR